MEGSSLKSFRKEVGEREKRVRKEGEKHAKTSALKGYIKGMTRDKLREHKRGNLHLRLGKLTDK